MQTSDMYQYSDFDQSFIEQRAAQYREQLERHLAGVLPDAESRPRRLQSGWSRLRSGPLLCVFVSYGGGA